MIDYITRSAYSFCYSRSFRYFLFFFWSWSIFGWLRRSVHFFVYDTTLFTLAVRHDTTVLFDLPILYYHTLIFLFSSYLLTTYYASKRWMAICLYVRLLYMDPLLLLFSFGLGLWS